MRRKKKTTIVTYESRERMTIRAQMPQLMAWCDQCSADVLMIAPNDAAAMASTDARSIYRGVESGEIHFLESADGRLLVCTNSLAPDPVAATGGSAGVNSTKPGETPK